MQYRYTASRQAPGTVSTNDTQSAAVLSGLLSSSLQSPYTESMKEISQKQLMMHSLAVACRTHYGIIPYLPARCMRMRTLRGSGGGLLRGRMPSCVDVIGSIDQNTEKTDGLCDSKTQDRVTINGGVLV